MTSSPFPPSPFPPSPFSPAPAAAPPPAASPRLAGPAPVQGSPGQGDPALGHLPENLEGIVRVAFERNYSDVHLGVGEEPRYRHRGDIVRTGWPATDQPAFIGWVREMLGAAELDSFLRDLEFDGSHAFPFVRVRINLMVTLRGPAMVLRLIPQTIPSLEDLNLPPVLRELSARPKSLVLVTGPTGSGKSTTLAAMIDWINTNMSRHILTIEDPVEFVHESRQSLIRHRGVGEHTKLFHNALRAALREDPIEFLHRHKRSIVNQREVGLDTHTYSDALKNAMREAPDVIMIGEIRDRETLTTALEASQAGHLMFGTLHTNSAVRTVERVLGMFPPNEQDSVRRAVSESLLGVISQGLLKTTDGKRCAFHDIFINTDACKDYILKGDLDEIEDIMGLSALVGMQTSNQALLKLVEDGRVEAEDALAQSLRPNELAQALRGRT
ncbi:MAG: type IV pilus twitching motility protein PilT [Cyanobium sp.]